MRKLICLMIFVVGCGRYEAPVPPEARSPRAIQDLKVTADLEGINFQWGAPDSDLLGDELKFIEGYNVYRKPLTKKSDIVDPDVEFELIATVPDTHIVERDRLREEARSKGVISRRVEAPSELTHFSYSDRNLTPGQQELYKIVPYNQGDVEGEAVQLIRVLFRGQNSEVVFMTQDSIRNKLDQPEIDSGDL